MNQSLRIAVADDEPDMQKYFQKCLPRLGHQVVAVAGTGLELLERCRATQPDLVITDIKMPDMDGIDAAHAICKDRPVPVILVSAFSDAEPIQRAEGDHILGYLVKPIKQTDLEPVIALVMRRFKQLQALRRESADLRQALEDRQLAAATPAHMKMTQGIPARPTQSVGASSATPQRVGDIAIQRLLGRGGMGNVWLGHHELLDLPVAVKLLRPELLQNKEMENRILREARLAARITSRNVVRLVEAGEAEHGLYLAYEYVDGGSLEDLLRRQPSGRLSISDAVRITREIALGLIEVNWLSITHRDVKPANILLTRTGEVKIADLGLAKEFSSSAVALTGEYTVVGTPMYMAPEQIECGRNLDIRCDLYAVGAVLYQMLAGQAPFMGPTPMALLSAHLFQSPQPPAQLRPDIPAGLEAICLKLLAKSPNDRYPLPEALLTDLQALDL